MNTRLLIILLAAVLSFFDSCITYPVSETASLRPIADKIVAENLGTTSGEDSAFSLFGLCMFGRPDMDKAVEIAVKNKGADSLINIRCYETTSYFILFSVTTIRVEGEAVKLSDIPKETAPKGKKK